LSDSNRPCDLCALPVGIKPFALAIPERTLEFCCEGCKGIYEMLHQIKEAPAAPAQNETTDIQGS